MSTLTVPYNIRSHAAALAEGLSYGDKIHIGTVGNHRSDDLFFIKFYQNNASIEISNTLRNGIPVILHWCDITELWLLEKKPVPGFKERRKP